MQLESYKSPVTTMVPKSLLIVCKSADFVCYELPVTEIGGGQFFHFFPSFQEVRNETNDESDEPIDVDVHDEEDNQEAAMLIDYLVRLAPGRRGAAAPLANGDSFNALHENIGPVIVELNG